VTHKLGQLNPLQAAQAQPEELANVALFLCSSDQASYVNGQAIAVDGGLDQLASGHTAIAGADIALRMPLVRVERNRDMGQVSRLRSTRTGRGDDTNGVDEC
jgi:hypothetical protein